MQRQFLAVAMVVLVALCGLGYFIMRTGGDGLSSSTRLLHAEMTNASGIRLKTRVQVAGLDVGKVQAIGHTRDKDGKLIAKVTLSLSDAIPVYSNARLRKTSESILGDYRLDLEPGGPDGTLLPDGGTIGNAESLSDIDELKGEMIKIVRNVNRIVESMSTVLAGEEGEASLRRIITKVDGAVSAVESTTRALESTIRGNDVVLGRIIQNVGQITDSMATLSQPGGDLPAIGHNVANLSKKLDDLLASLQVMLAGNRGGDGKQGEAQAMADGSLHDTMAALNASAHNLDRATQKVAQGEGTVGRLINDPAIADKIESTLDGANSIAGPIGTLQTQIELRSEYGVPFTLKTTNQVQAAIKNTLALRLFTRPDKYYILEAVADPRGRQTRVLTSTQIGNSNTQIVSNETRIAFNELKFSAQFAKRYYFLTLRFGIIENTGGLGLNLHGFHEHGELRIDMYDFDRRNPNNAQTILPRLRATGMFEVANHLHLQAGFDDPLNDDLRTWFLGGVLRFTDEDLKAFMAIAPKP